MNRDPQLTAFLRKISIYFGLALLVISIYLSYDGFDGSVSGSNQYSVLARIIGFVFAITVSALQFIFATDYRGLNKTLRFAGLFSYIYSIYTNKLGVVNLLGMGDEMAWATAVFSDIVAEPMIAWGLGEAVTGDFVGNLMKSVFGSNSQSQQEPQYENRTNAYNADSEPMRNIPRKAERQNDFFKTPTYHSSSSDEWK